MTEQTEEETQIKPGYTPVIMGPDGEKAGCLKSYFPKAIIVEVEQ